jgi:hypothetical protein
MNRPFALRLARAAAAFAVVAGASWFGTSARANDATIDLNRCSTPATPSPTPAPTCTPREGQAIEGTWKVAMRVQAAAPNKLRRVHLFIVKQEEGQQTPCQKPVAQRGTPIVTWGDPRNPPDPAFPPPSWADYSSAPTAADLSADWDTLKLSPSNAKYTLSVDALTQSPAGPESQPSCVERKDIIVDNPPVTPGKPVVVLATSDGVKVTWTDAPEPDLLDYTLYRARTSSSSDLPDDPEFRKVVVTTKTDIFDDVSQPGAYWYKVRTARVSFAQPDGRKTSELSEHSDKAGVVVAPTPSPVPPPQATLAPLKPNPLPLPKVVVKPAPVPEAPFSAVLPYPDDLEEGPAEAEPPPEALSQPEDSAAPNEARTAVVPVAVGAFLVSAAVALSRMPAV